MSLYSRINFIAPIEEMKKAKNSLSRTPKKPTLKDVFLHHQLKYI